MLARVAPEKTGHPFVTASHLELSVPDALSFTFSTRKGANGNFFGFLGL
jgi:hypothetical protein